jgi:hypothetical protein
VGFPSSVTRLKGTLEIIHRYVFRIAHIPSLGGSIYYVSFVDDFSEKKWLYFLKKKS